MRQKLKVNGESAQRPGVLPLAAKLVENNLVGKHPVLALATLAGSLLRLFHRTKHGHLRPMPHRWVIDPLSIPHRSQAEAGSGGFTRPSVRHAGKGGVSWLSST